MMLKTQPLHAGGESNLRDRVLGEVERNSFVVFARQKGTRRAHALQNYVSQLGEDLVRSFIAMVSVWGC